METQYRFRCGWICGNSYTLSRTSQAIFHDFSASNATDPARMIAHNEDYQMVRTSEPRPPPSLHINNNPRRSSALHKSHDDNLSRILLNCMSKAWYTQIQFGTFDAAFLPNRKGESKIQRHIFSFDLPISVQSYSGSNGNCLPSGTRKYGFVGASLTQLLFQNPRRRRFVNQLMSMVWKTQ